MADVRSKNLYELLGNDPELDPERPPTPPTRALDRPVARHGKREAPKEAPSQPRENAPRRAGRTTGNEAAFRDRNAGRDQNREKPTEEGSQPQRRAFRGERGDRSRNDRQSRTGVTDTRKQVEQGWGANNGDKNWDDERAAEKIAKGDENEPQTPAEEKPEEPVDKSKSYADYLAEQAAKLSLAAKPVRAANEGSKTDKKWTAAKEFKRDEEDEEYIKASSEKAKREKQRKEKNFVDVDMRFVEQPRGGPAPRGAGRGGRGGRGAPRGARGAANGPRGGGRGAAAAAGAAGPTVDEKNFPTLGGN
ncbi:hypothetical protein ASPZODRAFT_127738 [Penicilliopsis zonata CBS 506.65]|uniref:Hyaluronan/mRNA-binding protein domain-containing protein n=1 Tax=Penicilliopsis zonata CBS 506.65 TaxID=1073090 RepID=A0A1L9SWX1_9EURO|nr:hypothetical protein ASPZODRAFT_127738 [Penicilliopsis zonata CBS 506.65]OJJ51627.1 hypothetical protein ASPZODRAFT_127738 [Penicilliopsis zonata CBS 506.65]